jgi:hypothetical protein
MVQNGEEELAVAIAKHEEILEAVQNRKGGWMFRVPSASS